MVSKEKTDVLLSWSKLIPISEGQDPLGLNLRVSARLGSQLFYCITSVTPRARYYSLLPWCIYTHNKLNRLSPLRETVSILEKAFVIGSLLFHGDEAGKEISLVGLDTVREWFNINNNADIDLSEGTFVVNPAYDAYLGSLINLEFIKGAEIEESETEETPVDLIGKEIELTPLGQKLAEAYGSIFESSEVINKFSTGNTVLKTNLKNWGEKGALSELKKKNMPDRKILCDVFFNRINYISRSHIFRRHSLLLILELIKKLSKHDCKFHMERHKDSVYYNSIIDDEENVFNIEWSPMLRDIANRWRIFYFHYFFSAVFENLFVNIVNMARSNPINGFRLDEMILELNNVSVRKRLNQIFSGHINHDLLELSPKETLNFFGLNFDKADVGNSTKLNKIISISHPISEKNLHRELIKKENRFTPESTVIALVLWSIITLRFIKIEDEKYGTWASNASSDPYLDISVPVVLGGVRRQFKSFWDTSWDELGYFLIDRFVVRHHQLLAYQKSGAFFYNDQNIIRWHGRNYDKPNYKNPRLPNALSILKDLGLVQEDNDTPKILRLTQQGEDLLDKELSKEQFK